MNRFRRRRLLFALLPTLALVSCGDAEIPTASRTEIDLGSDPAARIREILATSNRLDRAESLVAALRALPADRFDALGEVLDDRVSTAGRGYERILMISTWAQQDPAAATEYAVMRELTDSRDEAIGEAVLAWATEDPGAVLEKYGASGLIAKNEAMLVAFVRGWFASGEPGVDDYVRDLGLGDERQRAVDALVRARLARDGSVATQEWALGYRGDAAFRLELRSRLGGALGEVDPEQAVVWCDRVCGDDETGRVAHMIATSWAEHQGADAMDWLMTRPDEVETWATTRAAFRRFVIRDKAGALAWVEAIPSELRRESLYQGPIYIYVNERSWQEPEVAIEWADYITHRRQRRLALITIARRWLAKDEPAAEAWLAQSPLSEADRAKAYELPKGAPVSEVLEHARREAQKQRAMREQQE